MGEYCDRNFLVHVPQSFKERKCFVRDRLQLFPAFSECLKQRRERHRVYLQQHSNEQRDLLPNGRVKLASFVCLLLSWNIGPESEQLKCPSHKSTDTSTPLPITHFTFFILPLTEEIQTTRILSWFNHESLFICISISNNKCQNRKCLHIDRWFFGRDISASPHAGLQRHPTLPLFHSRFITAVCFSVA